MKKMKKITICDDGEEVLYRYSVTKAHNVRMIHMERYEADEDEEYCLDENDIFIAKADWYCIAFPDMGTASPSITSIEDYGFVYDQVDDAGYGSADAEAITLAIMDIADTGF